jgi:Fe2+ or Zn2+ uptake regulation protein
VRVPEEWARRLSPRRAAVLTELCAAGEPLSTTPVRERVNRAQQQALVAEHVYGTLAALERSGFVRRVRILGSRNAFWEAAIQAVRDEVG